ncbi:GbsR/MarR family transcriptional regulator [Alicyclobacillus mengziensis]|uniref:HTH-type transcriptional regulator n=1 Tax=Alicyclobacillus mengziensis TaxID=2931921 RepID=A0A9X7Z4C5_9BACL|nr:hypothetical protein [Alicyclobacillus mengziensis]QSO45844.1 hypothetical protein JZ786_15000 [Alicyclobacillus mengziensis]
MSDDTDVPFRVSLEHAREELSRASEQTMRVYGYPESVVRIYGALSVCRIPLTFDEVMSRVGLSRASVNNGLRVLIDIGSVVKLRETNRNVYVVERNFFKNFAAFIVRNLREERSVYMRTTEEVLPTLEEVAASAASVHEREEAQFHLAQVRQNRLFYDWLNQFADFLETGKVFDCLPKPAGLSAMQKVFADAQSLDDKAKLRGDR